MASRFNVPPAKLLATLKDTVFKGATDSELLALVVVANEYGLNPLTKEIYAFPAKGGGIVPVVSIDGWINRMNSNPQFDGIEFADEFGEGGKIFSCTAKIHRKDRSHPVVVTEYLSECYRSTDPWNKCPSRMLRHRALMQGVRVAFGFGGVYDEDDAELVQNTRPTSREPAAPVPDALKPKIVDAVEMSEAAQAVIAKLTETGFSPSEYAAMYSRRAGETVAFEYIMDEWHENALAEWPECIASMEAAKKGGKGK